MAGVINAFQLLLSHTCGPSLSIDLSICFPFAFFLSDFLSETITAPLAQGASIFFDTQVEKKTQEHGII